MNFKIKAFPAFCIILKIEFYADIKEEMLIKAEVKFLKILAE
jgi:hypothetical protein